MSGGGLLDAFVDGTLPPAMLGHRTHLRITWIYLQREPLPLAIALTWGELAGFARHHGATDKFNRTLTETLVRLMAYGGATDASLA